MGLQKCTGARHEEASSTICASVAYRDPSVHLVTSSLFLPLIVAYISPTSTAILLCTYLLNTLALYVAHGSLALPIADFFNAVAVTPAPPAASLLHNTPADRTLMADNCTPSAWLAITQSTLEHPDDHLCKLQRSLAHFDSLYGILVRYQEVGRLRLVTRTLAWWGFKFSGIGFQLDAIFHIYEVLFDHVVDRPGVFVDVQDRLTFSANLMYQSD